jgi:hypothetical protein
MPRFYHPAKTNVALDSASANVSLDRILAQQAFKKRVIEDVPESTFIQSMRISDPSETPPTTAASNTLEVASEKAESGTVNLGLHQSNKRDLNVKENTSIITIHGDLTGITTISATEPYNGDAFPDNGTVSTVETELASNTSTQQKEPVVLHSPEPLSQRAVLGAQTVSVIPEPLSKIELGSTFTSPHTSSMATALNSYIKEKARRKVDLKWEDLDLEEHNLSMNKLCEDIVFAVYSASKFPEEVLLANLSPKIHEYEFSREESPGLKWNTNLLKVGRYIAEE